MSIKLNTPPNPADLRNLIIAVLLSSGLLFMWQYAYQQPKMIAQQEALRQQKEQESTQQRLTQAMGGTHANTDTASILADSQSALPRETVIAAAPRVRIQSPALHGSINLDGLRFDDLTLVRHRVAVDPESPEVILLTPAQAVSRYFLQVGWLAGSGEPVDLPTATTRWKADKESLVPDSPVTLSWVNAQGITFRVRVGLDRDYLFTLEQEVVNASGAPVKVIPYGLINRTVPVHDRFSAVIHEGPIAVMDGELIEVPYSKLEEDKKRNYSEQTNWLGVADKYWLTAFIPAQGESLNAQFQYLPTPGGDRTQVDFTAPVMTVGAGDTQSHTLRIFAGAKELNVLDRYKEALNLPLFDRALDFGVLYFLTRPIFLTLEYFYGIIGNFGLAIMLLVVLLKVLLYPLSNKSYHSMAQMRALQPKIEEIRASAGEDKLKAQQAIMQLWQKEKVNPLAGCLPVLIQIPVFFALYKVLIVSIEMRHAPFYGWIHDLSAEDPTNLFTLFGLVDWSHPTWMHLGAWPIIMAATMYMQQKMNPKPSDPIQEKVFALLPFIFLVMFATFPAGLLIYWAWNNTLSVAQQWLINRGYERKQRKKAARASAAAAKG